MKLSFVWLHRSALAAVAAMPAILGAQPLPIGGAIGSQLAQTPPNIYEALAVDERIGSSLIIGDTSATNIGTRLIGPRYDATAQQYTGVVRISMKDANGAFGTCSGSLLWDRQTILTAAHCVTNTDGSLRATQADVRFRGTTNSSASDVNLLNSAASITILPGYSGAVIESNDIAVIRLNQAPPEWAESYNLFAGNPLNQKANFSGWGRVGDGNTGDALQFGGQGRRMQGSQQWNAFANTAGNLFSGGSNQGILVYDFDNGSYNRNRLCSVFGLPDGSANPLCETGYGLDEVGVGRGDSGGPGFVFNVLNGKWEIAGVASWGTGGFAANTETGACPNSGLSCFGAFGGHTAVGRDVAFNFITAQTVPEPGTWALMVVGLAGISVVTRRRNVA
ncbi:MAG: trypsin-like serine protease [Gemmatimonas sp.]|nr:trypsin-like serine protease [Gemmatimonas sp.]